MIQPGGLADQRRLLRFTTSAALAALICALVMQLGNDGPRLWLAGLASAAALWPVLHFPRPAGLGGGKADRLNAAGRLILLAGLGLLLACYAAARFGEQSARIGTLCEGQSAQMGGWNLRLERITPVAGEGFTAIEAAVVASRGQARPITLEPQLRSNFVPGPAPDPASRTALWSGDLALVVAGFDPSSGCIGLDASWQPLAGPARIGGWLAALGAALIALVALGALRWRWNARERIAMRREEWPLPGERSADPMSGKAASFLHAAGLLLALCLAGYLALGSPTHLLSGPDQPPAPFARGEALVAARQSLLEGPANTNRWIVIGDALARRGRFADASELLLGAVEADPRDPDGWLALGDALYGHTGGQLAPASVLAYDRADRAALARGAALPPAGLAMEASGRSELAQLWWRRVLARPDGTGFDRAAIEARLNYSTP